MENPVVHGRGPSPAPSLRRRSCRRRHPQPLLQAAAAMGRRLCSAGSGAKAGAAAGRRRRCLHQLLRRPFLRGKSNALQGNGSATAAPPHPDQAATATAAAAAAAEGWIPCRQSRPPQAPSLRHLPSSYRHCHHHRPGGPATAASSTWSVACGRSPVTVAKGRRLCSAGSGAGA